MSNKGKGLFFGPLVVEKVFLPPMTVEDREDSYIDITRHEVAAMGADNGDELYRIPCILIGENGFNLLQIEGLKCQKINTCLSI